MKRKKQGLAGLLIAAACLLLTGCAGTPSLAGLPVLRSAAEEAAVTAEELPEETERAEICVYICGCVRSPGIFYLPEGARMIEAVEAAGGFLPEADTESRNLAQKLMDGEQIRIPSLEESREGQAGAAPLVNLNTADREELMTLSGIGEVRAEAILRYREEQGPFRDIEEITQVSGIGQAAFEKLKRHIRV